MSEGQERNVPGLCNLYQLLAIRGSDHLGVRSIKLGTASGPKPKAL